MMMKGIPSWRGPSHDGESAYMLGLFQTSGPIHWPHHNECGLSEDHNCAQTLDADREAVFLTTTVASCKMKISAMTQQF